MSIIAPHIITLKELKLPEIESFSLSNGIQTHCIPSANTNAVKLDVLVLSGRPAERKKMVSKATGAMLSRGTEKRDRNAIDDLTDSCGAGFLTMGEPDLNSITLFTIRSQAEKLLPLCGEVIQSPAFSEIELIKFIKRSKQKLKEDLNNPSIVTYRKVTEEIFGSDHPYGYNTDRDRLELLKSEDLVLFHLENYFPSNIEIILSGRVDSKIQKLLDTHLGQWSKKGKKEKRNLELIDHPTGTFVESWTGQDSQEVTDQTSFCIARSLPKAGGREGHLLQLLSMQLGGYFGSRLIKNIREEKGLAYDIQSSIDHLRYGGLFMISGECNQTAFRLVQQEVEREMEKLCQQELGTNELEMLKNYSMGVLMNNLDGPLQTAELLKSSIAEGEDISGLEELVNTIQTVTPNELKSVATKFLNPQDFYGLWLC